LTIDFPDNTYVYDIHFNANQLTESRLIYKEDTKSCSISRYDPGSKLVFSLCHSKKKGRVYVRRTGADSSNSPEIFLNYEQDKGLENYEILLISSSKNKFVELIVYKKGD
jgi:hypothetical protein